MPPHSRLDATETSKRPDSATSSTDSRLSIVTTPEASLDPAAVGVDSPPRADTDTDATKGEPFPEVVTPTTQLQRRRKRDVVRQISLRLYLKGKDMAEDVLRNVVPARVDDAEAVVASGGSALEHEIAPSRKTRKHLWLPKTQDDSVLLTSSSSSSVPSSTGAPRNLEDVNAFFLSRVTDPTSYFYRFHFDDVRHLTPQKAEVQLVGIHWLKPHEQVVSWERVSGLKKATISWDAYTEPLLVDIKTGAILDGHHRYNVGLQLRLKQLPAVLVDYLGDHTITVDVWPGCGRTSLTKEEVIEMSLSPDVFPPKTSRHRFTESLPPISIPLSVLRQNPTPINDRTVSTKPHASSEPEQNADSDADADGDARPLERSSSLRKVSISLICGAQNLATSVTKSIFRSRLRKLDHDGGGSTTLDLIKRPARPAAQRADLFTAIRENDPTSSFCRQKAATFEDLLSSDASRREKFYLTRVCDPTSYFYKYHFDATHKREPKKLPVMLASITWLKAHEHVVSWDRVDGLRRATEQWNAYLEPLLVDIKTGAILDGHHRYHVGKQLGLHAVPCVMVDYLGDDSITVDVWPNCGRDSLTKQEVIAMSLSDGVFPPKTSRHTFSDDLPPISVPLARLRAPLDATYAPM